LDRRGDDELIANNKLRAKNSVDHAWCEQTIVRSRTEEQDTLGVREVPPAAHQDVSLIATNNEQLYTLERVFTTIVCRAAHESM
jgi:hypothetical protein